MRNKQTGSLGERIARDFLLQKGYKILDTNFHTRFGELDIIALHKDILVFIEVKTRNNFKKGKPYEAVNLRKLHHLKRAIYYYLLTKGCKDYKLRLDVIAILLEMNSKNEVRHYENVEMG